MGSIVFQRPVGDLPLTAFSNLRSLDFTIGDLSIAEGHDCFTIAELIQYEAMGLTALGQGYVAVRDGWTEKPRSSR